MAANKINMDNIVLHRLYNQRLEGNKFKTPSEVVARMGAVQGQEYPYAKWALGLRTENATDDLVEQAFNSGAILRTHVMRPTWHFVTPADIRWMLELTAPRVRAVMRYAYRQLEIDDALCRRSNAAIVKALRGGKQLTREELRDRLQKAGVAVESASRMGFLMMRAELDGIVCSGPRRAKQFTYMLLDERAPNAKTLRRDEALVELTRRYFSSHGPATLKDFAWWSGLTVADAKTGLAELGSQFIHEVISGQTYWFSASQSEVKDTPFTAHLLPVLDEHIVAYRDPSLIYDPAFAKQAKNRNFVSTIAMDGQIVGEWKPVFKKDAVEIVAHPFTKFTPAQKRALDTAAHRYSEFLGLR
jgi:hypothetical protein